MTKDKNANIGIDSGEPKKWKDYIDAENKITRRDIKIINKNINAINIVMVGIVIALFIAFLFLITDDYMFKAEMYKGYKSDIKALDNKIDKLTNNNN